MSDAMTGFELYQPTGVEQAVDLIGRYGSRGWILTGGYDSLDWFKDRVKAPQAVIDIQGVAELRGVRPTDGGGIEIGALTTLTEVTTSPTVRDRFRLLADAAGEVASPQIRNAGTLGGNLCQDTRCWYYRYGVDCYRAGGNTCYAAAPDAQNREHAIFGASRCVAVSPSDTAPALVALDAEMVVLGAGGERVIRAEDFFMEPAVDITRMTVLEPDELLVSVRIPSTWADAHFYFEKVADRNSWDFALASIAAAFKTDGVRVEDARIAFGAVQCTPRRMTRVEEWLRGRALTPEGVDAAAALASKGAQPLAYNEYKIPLVQNLVKRALRSV